MYIIAIMLIVAVSAQPDNTVAPSFTEVMSSSFASSDVIQSSSTSEEWSSSDMLSSLVPSISESLLPSVSLSSDASSLVWSSTDALSSSMEVVSSSFAMFSTDILPSESTMIPVMSSAMPSPKPTPDYKVNVTLKNPENNQTCLWFDADIMINYTASKTESGVFTLTKPESKTGKCSNFSKSDSHSSLVLYYKNYTLELEFAFSGDSWNFKTIRVNITESEDMFGESMISGKKDMSKDDTNDIMFSASKEHGFVCDQSKTIKLNTNGSAKIDVTFNKVKVQPFENSGKLAKVDKCSRPESDPKSSSIVPIAVGCALAGLIVIVLIAYLIGRRKSDSKGYQQV